MIILLLEPRHNLFDMWLMFRKHVYPFLLCCLVSQGSLLAGSTDPVVKFIENKNQWAAPVHFSARVPGGRMFVQPGRFTYYFLDEERLEQLHHNTHDRSEGENLHPGELINGHSVEVNFIGANTDLLPMAFGRSPEYYNYFIGRDTCSWASMAYAYEGFLYNSLYDGIGLKVYSDGGNLKYDYIIAPGANPDQIQVNYSGSESIRIDESGDLRIDALLAEMIEKKPVAYQLIDGKKIWIRCEYVLRGSRLSYSFPDSYDHCYELVIDPLLIFATYSGSTADNWGSTATPGEKGNLYSAGTTNDGAHGGNFPATAGSFQTTYGGLYDIGILKYDSTGRDLLYATYLGGSGTESPHSLVMNSSEELILLGTTSSSNFPVSATAYNRFFGGGTPDGNVVGYDNGSDIIVSRLNRTGNKLLASTLLTGTENDGLNPSYGALDKNYGDQLRGDVITDVDGNIYISTVTASSDFPIVNGLDNTYNGGPTDALLVKLDEHLSQIVWSTFLGGTGADASHTMKFDDAGNLYVGGGTTSADFPVSNGSYQSQLSGDADGWIAKIRADGAMILNATFTGTTAFDQVYFLDLNENNEVYVYGQTAGHFPVTPGVYSNPNSGQFVQKFNNSLTSLAFSTVFGSGRGIPDISPTAFLVNECNNLYLAGWGGAINFRTDHWQSNTIGMPVTADAYQRTTSGSDFYFMVLTDDAKQFLYGTFLGGTQSRTHVDGGTSRFDKGGIVYHAVCSGCAAANATGHHTSDFPTTTDAWSQTNNSQNCNNAAFKFDLSSLKARLQSNSVALDMPGLNRVCMPDRVVFQNFSTGGEVFEWDLGDGTKLVKADTSMINHQYLSAGKYTVSLVAIDKGTCKVKDSTAIRVNIFVAETKVQDDDAMCLGSPYTLNASGGASYDWISEDGSFHSTLATPVVNPADTMRYFVTVTEKSGCLQKDTVQLDVIPLIKPKFEIDRSAECFDRPSVQVTSTTDSLRSEDQLFFDFGDGTTSGDDVSQHVYKADGLYNVKLIGVREFCVSEETVPMPVFKLLIPNIITPGNEDSANDKFIIQYGDIPGETPATYGFKTSVTIYNRWGNAVYESVDYQYDWDGSGLAAGVYYYELTVDHHATCKSWIQLVK